MGALTETVEERIAADLKTTLAAVSIANGFSVDVRRVYEMEGSVLTNIEVPCITLLDRGIKEHYGSHDQVECRQSFTLALNMERSSGWQRRMRLFANDLKRALRVDCGRGTAGGSANAFDTHIVGSDVANEDDGFPLAVAEVDVEIQFRHLLSDPTVAI